MKTSIKFSYLILAIGCGSLLSCEGPEGPQGPAGAVGTAGQAGVAGPAGATGATGTANVTYTEWKSPTWSKYYRNSDNSGADLTVNAADSKNAALTKDVIDKADVHVYTKLTLREYDSDNGEYKLVERISNNAGYGYVKVPGKTTNTFDDFIQYFADYELLGVDYFAPRVYFDTRIYDSNQQKYVARPDLIGKTAADFREMVKNSPQFRMVIIPGSVKAGRSSVDFNDYEAVKKAFGIKD